MDIDVLKAFFADHPKVRAALLYGSQARGSAHEGSDVDIAIVADDLDFMQRIEMAGQLEDLLGRSVDLVDLMAVGQPLFGEVMKDGVELLGDFDLMYELRLRNLYEQEDWVPIMKKNQKLALERFLDE